MQGNLQDYFFQVGIQSNRNNWWQLFLYRFKLCTAIQRVYFSLASIISISSIISLIPYYFLRTFPGKINLFIHFRKLILYFKTMPYNSRIYGTFLLLRKFTFLFFKVKTLFKVWVRNFFYIYKDFGLASSEHTQSNHHPLLPLLLQPALYLFVRLGFDTY